MYSLHLLLLQLYLTFHSYGQYILYPWGYARRDTLDKKDLHNLGVKGAQAVRSLSGRKYSVGSAAKMLYPAAGMYVTSFLGRAVLVGSFCRHILFCNYLLTISHLGLY